MSTRIRRRSGRSEFQLPATTEAARKTPVRKPKKPHTHTHTHTHNRSGEKTQQKRAPRSSSLEDL